MMHTLLGLKFDPSQFRVVESHTHREFLDSAEAQVELSGRGRADALLKVISAEGVSLSIQDMMDLTGWSRTHVKNSIKTLMSRGEVHRTDGDRRALHYIAAGR